MVRWSWSSGDPEPLADTAMSLISRLAGRALDASIYFSFDRSGYERHARDFDPADLAADLAGRRVLVTGANSGLGKAAAHALAHLGAEVWLLCRSAERGRRARADLAAATGRDDARLELVDLADLDSVRALAQRLGSTPVAALVHNAGALLPERRLTAAGLEVTWATHVVGPFLLTRLLLPNLRAAGAARVVFVTSGGMYTQRLDLADLAWAERDFDGTAAYAQAKRAQVALTGQWAERLAGAGETGEPEAGAGVVTVNAMHPGWADTPGVRQALPRFWRFTRDRLRTPRQGADTIVWLVAAARLAGANGGLYFDRRRVPEHLLPWTRDSAEERRELWRLCCAQAGVADEA